MKCNFKAGKWVARPTFFIYGIVFTDVGVVKSLSDYLATRPLVGDARLLDVNIVRSGRQPFLKVVVDTPAGVTMDILTDVTHLIRGDSEVVAILGTDAFDIEVTSPGLEAGLRETWQYPRYIGHRLKVHVRRGATENTPTLEDDVFEGRLHGCSDKGIDLELTEGLVPLTWETIHKAFVQLEW